MLGKINGDLELCKEFISIKLQFEIYIWMRFMGSIVVTEWYLVCQMLFINFCGFRNAKCLVNVVHNNDSKGNFMFTYVDLWEDKRGTLHRCSLYNNVTEHTEITCKILLKIYCFFLIRNHLIFRVLTS